MSEKASSTQKNAFFDFSILSLLLILGNITYIKTQWFAINNPPPFASYFLSKNVLKIYEQYVKQKYIWKPIFH